MDARIITRLGPAAVFAVAALACPTMPSAWAGGAGHGGGMMHGGGPVGVMRFHPPAGGAGPRFGMHGLPPVSGVIHERPGARPYLTGYGHTNTATRFAPYTRAALGGFGHTATEAPRFGSMRPGIVSYGHAATAVRFRDLGRRGPVYGRGPAFRERFRFAGSRGRFGYGLGGGLGGYDAFGGDIVGAGSERTGWTAGSSGTAWTSASGGTYGGTPGDAEGYGSGRSYLSETPLAARFAEPPLAPAPGAEFDAGDRYAYAASADAGPGPRIIAVHGFARSGCTCAPRVAPLVYRYGVGTAY